jgi:hypothetical protein
MGYQHLRLRGHHDCGPSPDYRDTDPRPDVGVQEAVAETKVCDKTIRVAARYPSYSYTKPDGYYGMPLQRYVPAKSDS